MSDIERCWALVLAAGDGRRLRRLTTTRSGVAVPKQFCSLQRGPSLLHQALRRAQTLATSDRVCTIVAAQHARWWSVHLESALPAANIIVQPENRGTAIGILLPLLHILERDPRARLALLPSDHLVREEPILSRHLREAAESTECAAGEIVLLGFEPRVADPQLGYIVPGRALRAGRFEVERFVEKPARAVARELIERGALWNAFIIVADGSALLALFERRCSDAVRAMRPIVAGAATLHSLSDALTELYRDLPQLDFSSDVLQGAERLLSVQAVPECGWSDLGTPRRVAEALREFRLEDGFAPASARCAGVLSLAAQNERLRDPLASL
jgi:mannose-1-phosphate guanylyltransferase